MLLLSIALGDWLIGRIPDRYELGPDGDVLVVERPPALLGFDNRLAWLAREGDGYLTDNSRQRPFRTLPVALDVL